jgi:hypothetical protein
VDLYGCKYGRIFDGKTFLTDCEFTLAFLTLDTLV